jgi:Rap/ran-GAP
MTEEQRIADTVMSWAGGNTASSDAAAVEDSKKKQSSTKRGVRRKPMVQLRLRDGSASPTLAKKEKQRRSLRFLSGLAKKEAAEQSQDDFGIINGGEKIAGESDAAENVGNPLNLSGGSDHKHGRRRIGGKRSRSQSVKAAAGADGMTSLCTVFDEEEFVSEELSRDCASNAAVAEGTPRGDDDVAVDGNVDDDEDDDESQMLACAGNVDEATATTKRERSTSPKSVQIGGQLVMGLSAAAAAAAAGSASSDGSTGSFSSEFESGSFDDESGSGGAAADGTRQPRQRRRRKKKGAHLYRSTSASDRSSPTAVKRTNSGSLLNKMSAVKRTSMGDLKLVLKVRSSPRHSPGRTSPSSSSGSGNSSRCNSPLSLPSLQAVSMAASTSAASLEKLRRNVLDTSRIRPALDYETEQCELLCDSMPGGTFQVENGMRVVEPAETRLSSGTQWYRKYFFGHEHVNYVGTHEFLGPLSVSFRRTDAGVRSIFRTQTGNEAKLLPAKMRSLSSKKLLGKINGALVSGQCDVRRVDTNLELERRLAEIDTFQVAFLHKYTRKFKIGVLYAPDGARSEDDLFLVTPGSESAAFRQFLECIGHELELLNTRHYLGGLDPERDGSATFATSWQSSEIVYHVASMLPYRVDDLPATKLHRKRHIANDSIVIVFKEGDAPFDPSIVRTKYTQVYFVVEARAAAAGGRAANGGRHQSRASSANAPSDAAPQLLSLPSPKVLAPCTKPPTAPRSPVVQRAHMQGIVTRQSDTALISHSQEPVAMISLNMSSPSPISYEAIMHKPAPRIAPLPPAVGASSSSSAPASASSSAPPRPRSPSPSSSIAAEVSAVAENRATASGSSAAPPPSLPTVQYQYRFSVARKQGVPPFEPKFPQVTWFKSDTQFHRFFMDKLLSAQRACYQSPEWKARVTRSRKLNLEALLPVNSK